MTTGPNNPARFRPRYSVRTLAIFLTLVCVYFGAWEATKKYGVRKVSSDVISESEHVRFSKAPGPSLVLVDVHRRSERIKTNDGYVIHFIPVRLYYVWLFGPKIKLPFESEW